jgi:hypothetical protein
MMILTVIWLQLNVLVEFLNLLFRIQEFRGFKPGPGRRNFNLIVAPYLSWLHGAGGYHILSYSRNSPYFMETENSSPHLQEPTTCYYPKPDRSSTCPPIQPLEDPF